MYLLFIKSPIINSLVIIGRDASWIGRDAVIIGRAASRRNDVDSFSRQTNLYTIGQCEVVNQDKVISYNFHYGYVHFLIYVYFHNVCTMKLLFKPLGTRVSVIRKC